MTVEEWLARVRKTWQPLTPDQIVVIRSTLKPETASQK